MRTDRQTDELMDMKKVIVAFRSFVNAPEKNESHVLSPSTELKLSFTVRPPYPRYSVPNILQHI